MPYRRIVIPLILVIFSGVIAFVFTYGASKRTYVVPERNVTLHSAHELDELWHASGAHGRIAVIFARHLNPQFSGIAFPQTDYLDRAMMHGIVRAAYYIVPDVNWPDVVSENLLHRPLMAPLKTTENGFILLHDAGSIHVMPLSKFLPEKEKMLVVLDQGTWSREDRYRIDNLLKSGFLTTDLIVTIGDNAML